MGCSFRLGAIVQDRLKARGCAVLCAALFAGAPAWADDLEIEDPEIEKGEIEFEYRGGWFSGLPSAPPRVGTEDESGDEDDDEEEAAGEPASKIGGIENEVLRQVHEMEVEIGLTDWLQFQAGLEYEQERNEEGTGFNSLKLSEVEFAALFEMVPVPVHGVGATLFLGYQESLVDGEDATAYVIGPLVKAASGPLSATGNFYFNRIVDISETEFEDGITERTVTPDHWSFSYAGQVRYMAGGWIGFGAEAFGEVTDIGDEVASLSPQGEPEIHLIGPTLYLKTGGNGDGGRENGDDDMAESPEPSLEATLGLLFGLTDDTSDITLKWDAEVEF